MKRESGNTQHDAAERAERLQRDDTRRREQRQAADDGGDVEQCDPHEHAPMGPAGAPPFARRHGTALAGPHDAFDERTFADEAHDDGRHERQDGHDSDQRHFRDGQAENIADAGGQAVGASAVASPAAPPLLPPPARDADEESEQPEGFTGAGVMEPLSDDLPDGHALLPVPGREAHSLGSR